jgi:uncharacterized protein YqeY
MTIYEKIINDKNKARKNNDKKLLSILTVMIGEIQSKSYEKYNDECVISILKKIQNGINETIKAYTATAIHPDEELNATISNLRQEECTVRNYMPEALTDEEIENWLRENIKWEELKNKMMAIGIINKEFGSRVDGKLVKEIITNKF